MRPIGARQRARRRLVLRGRDALKTFSRYLLFHAPEWMILFCVVLGLDAWTEIPRSWLGVGAAAVVLKDLVLFPYVRSSYETVHHDPASDLVGALGQVVVSLDPDGWVSLGHERWRARLEGGASAVESGSQVRVCALEGQTLVVRPEEPGSGS